LNQVVNVVNMRKTERFTKQQVASLSGSFDSNSTGKMLEVARRQGLIASSFQDGPNEEKLRLYHSWDYEATDWTIDPSTPIVSDSTPIVNEEERDDSPIVSREGSDESSNEATSASEEPFVVVSDDKKEPDVVAAEGKEDIYNLF
jgi:hypothetical protein